MHHSKPNQPLLGSLRRSPLRIVAVAGLCASGGCGASAPSDLLETGTYQSGSRLRAHIYDAGEGATQFLWWFDATLQTQCTFADAGDGTMRCLPSGAGAPVLAFLDAACTQPGAVFASSQTPAPFVFTTTSSGTGTSCSVPTPEYKRLGQEQAADVKLYAIQSDGTCAQTLAGAGGLRVFTLGTAVDNSVFASAAVVTESRGAAIDVQVLSAEDGALQLVGAVDHARNAPCTVVERPSGGLVPASSSSCAPAPLAADPGWFADATCAGMRYAVTFPPFCGSDPEFTMHVSAASCPGTDQTAIVPLGAAIPATAAFYLFEAQCSALSLEPSSDYRLFPELTSSPTGLAATGSGTIGKGRLRAPVFTAAGDPRPIAADTGFVDTSRPVLCALTQFPDGVFRCVPMDAVQYGGSFVDASSNTSFGPFADANCTQQLAYGTVGGCAMAPLALVSTANGYPEGARHVTGPYHGPLFFSVAGACVSSTLDGNPDLWIAGNAVDLDTAFPVITERTE